MVAEKMCHCGKPLHYSSKEIESYMNNMIDILGEFVEVSTFEPQKTYKVPRHYIALHGLEGRLLSDYGFEEVSK